MISSVRRRVSVRRRRPLRPYEPIVAELFSVERLEEHGESLAAAQRPTDRPASGRRIAPRVAENGRILLESYRSIGRAIRDERTITPAAEWFVDNYHIVDEQLREIRDDLPADYYRQLPKLAEGHLAGYPRVLGIAWAYVAHTDSRFDLESLRSFVRAYERVEPLTIGELWAIAISLRIILVENLRRLAEQIVIGRAARESANDLVDTLLGLDGERTEVSAASFRRTAGSMPTAGLVQLVQRLRDQDPAVTPALGWLEGLLAEQGTTADEIVREEHQRQAAMNVTVRNVITSMRQISWSDWREFVESVSPIDELMREGSAFGALDFLSRDRYRHAIEELARSARRTELAVTQAAMGLAADAAAASEGGGSGSDELSVETARRMDPGYYLIADGRAELERALGHLRPLRTRFMRSAVAAAAPLYLGTIILLTLLTVAIPLALSWDAFGWGLFVVTGLALVPASEIAVTFVNWAVSHALAPRHLPRLDMSAGIPTELRTLVAVPTLLASEADIEAQIEHLEVRYLANSDGDIRFALLSDWLDADAELLPGDDALLATAVAGIERLNATHGDAPGGGPRFLLFHRERRWNASQGTWMGWERKRGKLRELNALLRGSTTTSFLVSDLACTQPPEGVRYVISLDADTRLPRGAAASLVGTMAHPLHRPGFSQRRRRVVDGYALLQPRITATLPTEHDASIFQRLFSGSAGIDPYTAAVSDVYQDLFREGSYAGKGIYDVDGFERALADRVPENALLSHDLFEGIFARAGLVTDIELFEEFPSRYEEATTAPAPLGARRLAAAAVDRRSCADQAHRTLEDAGQPPSVAGGTDGARHPDRCLDPPWRARGHVDPLRARVGRPPGGLPAPVRPHPATTGHLEAKPHPGGGAGRRPRRRPVALQVTFMAHEAALDGRRHRADAGDGSSSPIATCWSGSPRRRRRPVPIWTRCGLYRRMADGVIIAVAAARARRSGGARRDRVRRAVPSRSG